MYTARHHPATVPDIMKANELKRGSLIQEDGQPVKIKQIQVQTSSSRSGNTLYKVRGQNIVSRQKFEKSYKGDDNVTPIEVSRRQIQLLFRDKDGCTFMDNETYEQYVVSDEAIEDELPYMKDGIEGLQALIADDKLLGIELPVSVELEIIECAPAMRAASSSARTKPATLSTGLIVQVPEYLASGETIRVNTENGSFMSRC
jgi:elongation factor P